MLRAVNRGEHYIPVELETRLPSAPVHLRRAPVPVRRPSRNERGTGFLLVNRIRSTAARIPADLGSRTGHHRNPSSAHSSRTTWSESQANSASPGLRMRCTKVNPGSVTWPERLPPSAAVEKPDFRRVRGIEKNSNRFGAVFLADWLESKLSPIPAVGCI